MATYMNILLQHQVRKKQVQIGDKTFSIDLPESRRMVFLEGTWNALAMLKAQERETQELAKRLPYIRGFL